MKKLRLFIAAVALAATMAPAIIRADIVAPNDALRAPASDPARAETTLHVRVTAYASTPDETDSTPFITASGMRVHDGIVATNVLPFGTKIKIPALFGEKTFTVEDRMAPRMKNVVDVWMPTRAAALRFGANDADIAIVADHMLSQK
ncbi:MAG: hypothetical protein ABSE18_03445 [Minisyncoccia bacterium]